MPQNCTLKTDKYYILPQSQNNLITANLSISTHEGAISRWLMLNPEEQKPPSVVEMVRNATAKE